MRCPWLHACYAMSRVGLNTLIKLRKFVAQSLRFHGLMGTRKTGRQGYLAWRPSTGDRREGKERVGQVTQLTHKQAMCGGRA
jgi:hypothetical protein